MWSAAKVFAGSPAINKQILMSSSAAGQWHFCSRPSPSVSLACHDNGFGVVCRSIRWVRRSRAVQPNPNPGGWELWYFLPSQGRGAGEREGAAGAVRASLGLARKERRFERPHQ